MTTFFLLALLAQACTTPDPFVSIGGGTCIRGGWVPASLVATDIPPPPSQLLITSAPDNGAVSLSPRMDLFPAGEVVLEAPYTLTDVGLLSGMGPTWIKPRNRDYQGAVIQLRTSLPGNPDTGYPVRMIVRDLYILCANRNQIGLAIRGANILLQNITVSNCVEGIRIEHGINIVLQDVNLLQNVTGLYLAGYGRDTVTTVKVRGGIIGGSSQSGVVIRFGKNVTFDGTILEYNQGCGIDVTAANILDVDVQARDVWFEANTRGHLCGLNRVVFTGSSGPR